MPTGGSPPPLPSPRAVRRDCQIAQERLAALAAEDSDDEIKFSDEDKATAIGLEVKVNIGNQTIVTSEG